MELTKIYIICPVRKLTKHEKEVVLAYAQTLERDHGSIVRVPFRDTDQDDELGLRIIREHEDDIIWADEIHVWWNATSERSLWDFAQTRMARRFMPEKKIHLVNVDEVEATDQKSYTNVVLATHFRLTSDSTLDELKEKMKARWIS